MKVGELPCSEISQTFESSLDLLYAMLKFIKDQALHVGFSTTMVSKIELAAEEALVNIICHGYSNCSGKIEIICHKFEKSSLKITLIDQGISFNPLEAIKNFKPGNIETDELSDGGRDQIGGYGIYFIVNMMDSVEYKRVEEKNHLIMVKYLS